MIQNKVRKKQMDYTWPGFVDALCQSLMVIIFVLMIFVLSQFFYPKNEWARRSISRIKK